MVDDEEIRVTPYGPRITREPEQLKRPVRRPPSARAVNATINKEKELMAHPDLTAPIVTVVDHGDEPDSIVVLGWLIKHGDTWTALRAHWSPTVSGRALGSYADAERAERELRLNAEQLRQRR